MARLLLNHARLIAGVAILGLLLLSSGCTSLFFYPNDHQYLTPDQLELDFEEVQLMTADDEQLYGWWLPARGQPRGTVYFLHGNAQNISAHIVNVSWLPARGYNVFLIDYRGFGISTGSPDLEGVLVDSQAGLAWTRERSAELPVFILGQSLGGSLALLAAHAAEVKPEGVIIDGAFAGFRRIAREKLDQSWLTWPVQAPLSWLVPANREPLAVVDELGSPLLVIHSRTDTIVPFHHGRALYEAAGEPRQFLPTATPHGATFVVEEFREVVLEFMEQHRPRADAE